MHVDRVPRLHAVCDLKNLLKTGGNNLVKDVRHPFCMRVFTLDLGGEDLQTKHLSHPFSATFLVA